MIGTIIVVVVLLIVCVLVAHTIGWCAGFDAGNDPAEKLILALKARIKSQCDIIACLHADYERLKKKSEQIELLRVLAHNRLYRIGNSLQNKPATVFMNEAREVTGNYSKKCSYKRDKK